MAMMGQEEENQMGHDSNPNHCDALIEAAQGVLTDERHWTQVDVADRAGGAASLAEAILDFFDVSEGSCPAGCEDCKAQEETLDY